MPGGRSARRQGEGVSALARSAKARQVEGRAGEGERRENARSDPANLPSINLSPSLANKVERGFLPNGSRCTACSSEGGGGGGRESVSYSPLPRAQRKGRRKGEYRRTTLTRKAKLYTMARGGILKLTPDVDVVATAPAAVEGLIGIYARPRVVRQKGGNKIEEKKPTTTHPSFSPAPPPGASSNPCALFNLALANLTSPICA